MSETPITDAAYDAVRAFTNEEQAVDALIELRETSRKLERENAALRSDLSKCNNLSEIRRDAFYDEKSARWAMVDRMRELERENAAMRADKERLDWLLTDNGGFWVNWMYDKDEWTPELKASRDAIDACRNGRIGREKP